MALGTFTLEELVNMTRTRVRQYTTKAIVTEEIEEVLNNKSNEVFMLMPKETKKRWYGKPSALTLPLDRVSGLYQTACPADMWSALTVKHIYIWNGVTYRVSLREVEIDSFDEYMSNVMMSDTPAYDVVGDVIYTTFSDDKSEDSIMAFYIRPPVTMDVSNDFDMPDQFAELVIILSTGSIIASLAIDTDAKQIAMQLLAMQEKGAKELLGLPFKDIKDEDDSEAKGSVPIGAE